MKGKDKLKETYIKNRACYYFDDIMRVWDIDFSDILLEEKSYKTYKNILIYFISYKTFMGSIPLHIRFDEIDRFIKIYDGIRYLVLFGHRWYDDICDMITYLKVRKMVLQIVLTIILRESELTYIILYLFEKMLTFHNVIIVIKSVGDKNKSN